MSGVRPDLPNLGDRVWWAWNCLPRDKGRLPPWKGLEREHGISPATFSKLISGERSTVGIDTLPKLAAALRVSEQWLMRREGQDPTPSGPLIGRGEDRYANHDPGAWVRKYNAIGPVDHGRPNPFQVAAMYHGAELDADVVEAVAAEARGDEGRLTAIGWGRLLLERQAAKREALAQAKAAKRKHKAEPAPAKRRAAG